MTDGTPTDETSGGGQEERSEEMVPRSFVDDAIKAYEEKMLETFKPLFEEQGKRQRQSQRDAIRDQVGNAFNALLEKQGLSTAAPEATDEGSQDESSPPQETSDEDEPKSTSFTAAEMQAILEDNGLTGSEPGFDEWLKENEGQPWYSVGQSFADLAKDVSARKAGSNAPVGSGSGSAAKPELSAEYEAAWNELNARKARGELRHTEARDEWRRIKEEFRAKGLEVDRIGFGSAGSLGAA